MRKKLLSRGYWSHILNIVTQIKYDRYAKGSYAEQDMAGIDRVNVTPNVK